MPYYTPLRYPGGKRRLAPVLMHLLEVNRLRNITYAEAYAGGAAVALALLFEEYATTVHINDLSRPVYAFWHTVLNDSTDLCARIRGTRVCMAEWHRQRAVYDNRVHAPLADLGFATLFLNRTNRSGIIAGGVIGGFQQTGRWPLSARFTKPELIARIQRIARYRNRIYLHRQDAVDFTRYIVQQLPRGRTFAMYDPPYIDKSESLYLNNYDLAGHKAVAQAVTRLRHPWVVTYDAAALKAGLYPSSPRLIYDLSYSAQERYHGSEVMFLSKNLAVPTTWHKRRSVLNPGIDAALYGHMEPPAVGA